MTHCPRTRQVTGGVGQDGDGEAEGQGGGLRGQAAATCANAPRMEAIRTRVFQPHAQTRQGPQSRQAKPHTWTHHSPAAIDKDVGGQERQIGLHVSDRPGR